jgi:hypothetical protein
MTPVLAWRDDMKSQRRIINEAVSRT